CRATKDGRHLAESPGRASGRYGRMRRRVGDSATGGAPVPCLARQVVVAEAAGVAVEPLVAGGAPGGAVREVDGQAELVLRLTGLGGGRSARTRRHLVDGVVTGSAVRPAQFDLTGDR